jgi:hypothetical protein
MGVDRDTPLMTFTSTTCCNSNLHRTSRGSEDVGSLGVSSRNPRITTVIASYSSAIAAGNTCGPYFRKLALLLSLAADVAESWKLDASLSSTCVQSSTKSPRDSHDADVTGIRWFAASYYVNY